MPMSLMMVNFKGLHRSTHDTFSGHPSKYEDLNKYEDYDKYEDLDKHTHITHYY